MQNRTFPDRETDGDLDLESFQDLSDQIRRVSYLDPPEDLLPSVLKAIQQKRHPWWYRCLRWVRAPRSFTLSFLQLASFATVLVLVSFVGALYLLEGKFHPRTTVRLQDAVTVTLTLNRPEARSVAVVGTFNAWRNKGYEMKMDPAKGVWTLVLSLPAGRYEYAFVVDGQEIVPDPKAQFYEDDGFGNQNAVLIVGNHHEKAI